MTPAHYLAHLRTVYESHGAPFALQAPATAQDLDAVAQALGQPMDADLKALWQLAAGAEVDEEDQALFSRPGFVDLLSLLSPHEALAVRETVRERAPRMLAALGPLTDPRLSTQWWEPGWLPFADFCGVTILMVDGSPGPQGQLGQVIAFEHDPDDTYWVAPSLQAFLAGSAQAIDAEPEQFLDDWL